MILLMDNGQQPATQENLQQIKQEFKQDLNELAERINTRLAERETRLTETMRDIETELLRAFYGFTDSTQKHFDTGVQTRQHQLCKLLVKAQNRTFLVDSRELIYASIEDGLITVVTRAIEGTLNYRTIEELQNALDPTVFWRVHRSYLVNINRIKEVVPCFKSSYMLKMDDRKQTDVPVSRAQTKRLGELLKL